MWEKENIYSLLVGMQITAATVENSMESPPEKQKTKNKKTRIDLPMIQLSHFWLFIQRIQNY